jgi:ATP-dependent Lon protease
LEVDLDLLWRMVRPEGGRDSDEEKRSDRPEAGKIVSDLSSAFGGLTTGAHRRSFLDKATNEKGIRTPNSRDWHKFVAVLMLYFRTLCLFGHVTRELVDGVTSLLRTLPSQDDAKLVVLYEALTGLPFGITAPTNKSIADVRRRLDEALFGLDEVKASVRLELVLAAHAEGPAHPTSLLLAGPPGVGKTAVAEAIAQALGVPFIRISLAGHCDVTQLKGSAFVWRDSGIGHLAQSLIAAGCENCVLLLDEVDKTGGYSNSSVSDLLAEVLDPDQARRYADLFLSGITIDLSKCYFVLTANDLSSVPDFAVNRCKLITLRSYTEDERAVIIRKYFPRQIQNARRLGFSIEVSPEIAQRLACVAPSLRDAKRMLTELVALAIEDRQPGTFKKITIDAWDEAVVRSGDDDSPQPMGFRP